MVPLNISCRGLPLPETRNTSQNTTRKKETAQESRLQSLLFLSVLPAESFDASCGVDKLLLTGKERVTSGANLGDYLAFCGRTGFKGVAAVAFDGHGFVAGMDTFFHGHFSFMVWQVQTKFLMLNNQKI
jgi:hypothetical protein